MSTRNDAITRVARKIEDVGTGTSGNEHVQLSDEQIGEEVDAAVVQYSADRPLEKVVDITAQTTSYINVTGLTGWVNDWSQVLKIDYPAAAVTTSGYRPTWLQTGDWETYRDGSGRYIRLLYVTPSTAEILRFTYTAPHTLSASTDTLPATHFDAVCDLAASYCCERLATKYAASQDSTIAADSTNYRDAQLRFKQQAAEWQALYRRKVGLPEDGMPAISETFEWDTAPSNPYLRDRMWYPSRWR